MARSAEGVREALMACGYQVTDCRPLTAGASAETWRIVMVDGSQAILRLNAGADDTAIGLQLSKAQEAEAQRAAQAAGTPCAQVMTEFSAHPELGSGYLMVALPGESLPGRLLKDDHFARARQRFADDCARALARIHTTPLDQVSTLPRVSAADLADDLYQQHRQYGEPLPVFSLVHRWLQDHAPACQQPSLVHGDFRLGNVLLDQDGLTGVLDWEMAHLGDPMEDLGWLCVNAWRFGRRHLPVGGISEREALYRAYQDATGAPVDDAHVRYWELMGNFKWGVICQYQASTFLSGEVPSIERAAIGRRVAEAEYDMLCCLMDIRSTHSAA